MSSVTALQGAKFKGQVEVKDAGLQGMITLRGDLGAPKFATAVKSALGLKIPTLGQVVSGSKGTAAWMSPDELMLFVPYSDADMIVGKMEKSLNGVHSLVLNVSDARTVVEISGKSIRDVLGKGTPIDLSGKALPMNTIRRTRLGQVAVAFWLSDETTARLVCFRSVGQHVFDWLCVAADKSAPVDFY